MMPILNAPCNRRARQRSTTTGNSRSGSIQRIPLRRHHLLLCNREPRAGCCAHQGQTSLLPATAYTLWTGERPSHRAHGHSRLMGCGWPYLLGDPKRPSDGEADVRVHSGWRSQECECWQFGSKEVQGLIDFLQFFVTLFQLYE